MLDQYLQKLKQLEALSRQMAEELESCLAVSDEAASPPPEYARPGTTPVDFDPYSNLAAKTLASIQPLLKKQNPHISQFFYNNLSDAAKNYLNILNTAERQSLQQMQQNYILNLLSPQLSYNRHKELATLAGERHDAVSLPESELIAAYHIYRRALLHYIPTLNEDIFLMQIMERRLQNDMAWQLMGYTHQSQQRLEHLEKITEKLQHAVNRDDMLENLLEDMRQIDGIEGVSIGAFVSEQRLLCEKTTGLVLHGTECTLKAEKITHPLEQPLWRAWKDERPVWINSLHEAVEDQCLLDEVNYLGLRSYAVLPIKAQHDAPELLLVIYSRWPGYFLSHEKRFFFESIAREFSTYLHKIEQEYQGHFAPLGLEERQHYRTLLEQEAVQMVFQPIVDPITDRVVKIESLARLVDKDKFISPYHFLGAFGSKQLIALFEQGLRQVCKALVTLDEKGMNSVMASINLPTEAFDNPQIMYRIYATVHQYGIDPARIALEILETGSLNEDRAINALQKLREKGFSIALDDVGSGESSMLRMKQLPIDEIKIDQGFVRPLTHDLTNLDYVLTLIRLANNLNLSCVVEGVENETIIDMIKTLGGANLQGYGVAKPMPLEEMIAWIESRNSQPEPCLQDNVIREGYTPQGLSGWYARHLNRARIVLEAFPNNIDLLNLNIAAHAENCPLTRYLKEMGLEHSEIAEAHNMFHETVHLMEEKLVKEHQAPEQLKTQLKQVLEYMRNLIQATLPDAS